MEVAPMMGSMPWALVRDGPTWKRTDIDRYVRSEYGGPSAAWLLSAEAAAAPIAELHNEDASRESRFRRVAQAIAAFF